MEWLLFNFLLQIDDQLCSIGPVLQPSWKQNFRSKDQQHTDSRSRNYFYQEIKKIANLKPFQQQQVTVMKQRKCKYIYGIRRPTHCSCRRLAVIKFRGILWDQDIDYKWAEISD